jgi:hypothetical protein
VNREIDALGRPLTTYMNDIHALDNQMKTKWIKERE